MVEGAGAAGLLVLPAGLVLAAVTAWAGETWMLVPCAVVLGCAYGRCLVAGLLEVQRLADAGTLAGLTAAYYALTYVGACTSSRSPPTWPAIPPSWCSRAGLRSAPPRSWAVLRRRDRAV